MEEARKGRGGSVYDRCGLQVEPELYGGREGKQEGKRENHLFRIGVIGNGSLNKTQGRWMEGREERKGKGTDRVRTGYGPVSDRVRTSNIGAVECWRMFGGCCCSCRC